MIVYHDNIRADFHPEKLQMNDNRIKILYILGGGHSGSTVLSLILGAAPEVFNLGELKLYNQHAIDKSARWGQAQNTCMCGAGILECPFWSQVSALAAEPEVYYAPGIRGHLQMFARLIFASQAIDTSGDEQVFREILKVATDIKPTVEFLLDTSKSLPRYIALRSNPNLAITPIFLVRDGRGYLNSYRKRHKKGFLRWILQWAAVNFSTSLFLRFTRQKYLKVSYAKLCLAPELYLPHIAHSLDIQLPDNYISAVNETVYHVRAGNQAVLSQKTFHGLTHDDQWQKELSALQRWVANLIIPPLNRLFDK